MQLPEVTPYLTESLVILGSASVAALAARRWGVVPGIFLGTLAGCVLWGLFYLGWAIWFVRY